MKTLPFVVLILLSRLPIAGAQDSGTTKPPVGVPADAKMAEGSWFRVYLEKGGWRRAKDRCAVLGGRLAIIRDEKTNALVKELAGGVPLWLGATDEKTDGVWQWVDGSRITFKVWGPHQPNGSPKENYLSIWDGQWHDVFEGEPKVVGFVCEWSRK